MKKLCQCFLAFLMVFTLVCSYGTVVNAAGTTTMYLSSNSPKVGDTLKLTVTGSASSTITVKYNATILNFVSCDVSGYTQSGNAISFKGKTGNIDFKVAESGSANIIVSSDSLTGCSTQIAVTGTATQEADNSTATTETPETQTQETDAQDTSAEDTQEAVNSDASKLGTEEHYITVMTPDALFSDALALVPYTNEVNTYSLYQFDGVAGEFYYVYGENESGAIDWYVYDSTTGQFMRADTAVLSKVGEMTSEEETKSNSFSEYFDYAKEYCKENSRNILTILVLLIAVIIVIIINIRVFKNNSDKDDGSDIFGDEDLPKRRSLLSKAEKYDEDEDEDESEAESEKVDASDTDDDSDSDTVVPDLDMSVINEVLSENSSENEIVEPKTKKENSTSGNRDINLMDLNNL